MKLVKAKIILNCLCLKCTFTNKIPFQSVFSVKSFSRVQLIELMEVSLCLMFNVYVLIQVSTDRSSFVNITNVVPSQLRSYIYIFESWW